MHYDLGIGIGGANRRDPARAGRVGTSVRIEYGVSMSIRVATTMVLAAMCLIGIAASSSQDPSPGKKPWLIAHRGASAYAPENTVPAFDLAARQGADFVEFDLQLTKDRQIVCLHDNSLERTTDVEEVFPDRFRRMGDAAPRWMLEDFTLAEIKRLDAGVWFDQKFRGTRIPTFGETIDALRGRSGLFIELKTPERYDGIEQLILAELAAKGLGRPGADARTPVLLQSFTASSLQILTGTLETKLPVHFLVNARDAAPWLTPEGLAKIKSFATGMSPEKTIVLNHPDAMARAKKLGLLITPYTFRAGAVTGFPDVRAEMAHYLQRLHVDGVITDNPDHMPRSR
jgi:glycerophosphoryl diester phosphodiesterase